MPCKILQLLVKDGSQVRKGDGLLVSESMKTEVRMTARTAGTVKLHVGEGDVRNEGDTLLEISAIEK